MDTPIVDANTLFGLWPRAELDCGLPLLQKALTKHGLGKALAVSLRGIFHDCEAGNEETLKACAEDERLLPVATFHLREWGDYEAKLGRAKERGFRLVRLFPNHQGWSLSGEQLRLLAVAAGQVGLPLMVEVTASGDLTALARQTAEANVPVIAAGVNLSFAALLGEAIAVAKTHLHIHLETARFDAPGMYELVVSEIGAERVIYGSAAMLQYMASALGAFREAELSEVERRLIGGENILRLIGDRGE